MLVIGLILLIWGVGHLAGFSRAVRYQASAALLVIVILSHLGLPDGHQVRVAIGGDARGWVILGVFAALAFVYSQFLKTLKKRANARTVETKGQSQPLFSDTELERYARHIMLREIGGPGQKALKQAKVLVVGAGGLGAPVLSYLGAMGVGTIGIIDDDKVENSNLQRQVIHTDTRIGMPKVFSAKEAIEAQNPFVTVKPYEKRLTEDIAEDLFSQYDLILDGTDNFETRYLSNRVASRLGKPLISGALSQWEGQLNVFDTDNGTPCYQCIFPEPPAPGLVPSCAEAGVAAALPGVIGAMMAQEALKMITGAGHVLRGEMFIYDALYGETRKIRLKRRTNCPVCGQDHSSDTV